MQKKNNNSQFQINHEKVLNVSQFLQKVSE